MPSPIQSSEDEFWRYFHNLWRITARTEQLPPEGNWRVWYVRGARGAGKTRTGAETLAKWIRESPPGDWAIVAPTDGDARDTCLLGRSGLIKALGDEIAGFDQSRLQVRLQRGGVVYCDGADDGAYRIQGKNLRGAWCDEVGLWRKNWAEVAWDESIQFAVRLAPAKIVCTGTPKQGSKLVLRLWKDESIPKSLLTLAANEQYLDPGAVANLRLRYGGTRLGRQELEGEVLEDVPGALWTYEMFRHNDQLPEMKRIVVAIDPAVSNNEDSDETGIIAAGIGVDGRGYVLADCSGKMSPNEWASRAVAIYHQLGADRIVGEVNNGGDLIESVIRTADPLVAYTAVRASRGKLIRAEPIAALYEQGRIDHALVFPQLEDQMCLYSIDSKDSPDRLDALVWALTELMLDSPAIASQTTLVATHRSS